MPMPVRMPILVLMLKPMLMLMLVLIIMLFKNPPPCPHGDWRVGGFSQTPASGGTTTPGLPRGARHPCPDATTRRYLTQEGHF